jgi:nucleotide-binding universal stress UspA family protein
VTEVILVAIDGSETSMNALEFAIEESAKRDAQLHGIYVIETYHSAFNSPYCQEGDTACELLTRILEEESDATIAAIREKAAGLGGTITVHKKEGHPGAEIIRLAEELNAMMIIAGSLGKTGIERVLVGSTGHYVVNHSPITTVIVKASAKKGALTAGSP